MGTLMDNLRRSLVYIFLILGLAAALGILLQRVGWDRGNRKVMLVFDAGSFSLLAQAGVPVSLPSPAAVGVSEATIRSLNGLGYLSRVDLADGGDTFRFIIPRARFFEFDTAESSLLTERIRTCLSWQLTGGFDVAVQDLNRPDEPSCFLGIIALPPLSEEDRNHLALGFYLRPEFPLPDEHALIFRPNGNGLMDAEAVKRKFSWMPRDPRASSLIVFSGTQVPGYPSGVRWAANELPGELGLVEFSALDGDRALASCLPPERVFWVHSIPPDEIPQMSPDAMVQRFLRALRERNPRVLYIHPVTASQSIPPRADLQAAALEANSKYVRAVMDEVRGTGFEPALKLANPSQDPPLALRAPVVLLVYLGILWFVLIFFPGGRLAAFMGHPATMLAGLVASFPIASIPSLRALAALVAALAFPLVGIGYALKYYCEHPGRGNWRLMPLWNALAAFGIAFLFTLLGGLIIYSLLTGVAALVKMEVFHGVILSRGVPVIVALAYFYNLAELDWAPAARNMYTRIDRVFGRPVTYLDLALIVILVAALGIALLRAGNDFGFLVSGTETTVRGTLEQIFGVRPRTTELVGHFAMIAFFVLLPWGHRSLLLLLAAGTMALSSVVNTFSHLHTPLMVSVYRTLLGLMLSLLAAVVAYVIVWAVASVYRALGSGSSARGAHGR